MNPLDKPRAKDPGPFPERKPVHVWREGTLLCAVVPGPWGRCNGYVQLPEFYPVGWVNYDDIPVDVHGGLSYGPDENGWVGFDIMHAGDIWQGKEYPPDYPGRENILNHTLNEMAWIRPVVWNEELVALECENLAKQLAAKMRFPRGLFAGRRKRGTR